MKKTSEVLADALEIVKGKWGKGFGEHHRCSIQAITDAEGTLSYGELPYNYLRAAVNSDIVDWNDAPNTTQKDVIAGFAKAIELAKADGN